MDSKRCLGLTLKQRPPKSSTRPKVRKLRLQFKLERRKRRSLKILNGPTRCSLGTTSMRQRSLLAKQGIGKTSSALMWRREEYKSRKPLLWKKSSMLRLTKRPSWWDLKILKPLKAKSTWIKFETSGELFEEGMPTDRTSKSSSRSGTQTQRVALTWMMFTRWSTGWELRSTRMRLTSFW